MKAKSKLNFLIDVLLLLLLMGMAGLGLLIKYLLVPGFKRNELFGSKVELYFMGLDRHQWGSVHLWVSLIFTALVVLHIILHWKQIVCWYKQLVIRLYLRLAVSVVFVLVLLTMVFAPFFLKPQTKPFFKARIHQTAQKTEVQRNIVIEAVVDNEKQMNVEKGLDLVLNTNHNKPDDWERAGAMSLTQLAQKYNIDEALLAKSLNIPSSFCSEKIGRLKRIYGFDNEKLKEKVNYLIANNNN
ncbi:MAG: DUF4405 domain-containing protein [Prolixibacteraceae bacterium]|nr:DUF4405 domain-containing protein [Prolixibacteraceae bacterium]